MLRIYNTLTRQQEDFKPIKKGQVSFYHCGPTVYWTQHIGNMRAMVLADLIRRSFEYLGFKVKFVRNFTDVGHLTSDEDTGEDKMAKGAKREGLTPDAIAQKYIKIFENDIHDLNIIDPDIKPRATEHVKEIIAMVQTLLDKGYAYSTDLAIYFDTTKAKNYTQLSGQNMEENKSEAGKADVADKNKKHPADFAVWFFKAGVHKNALQTWPSPFSSPLSKNGEGFPGWHIECSAMSRKYLGDTLDIHMGGIEHVPVHHTNEIAQSESATGKKFVNYWLHNEHLNVNDGKMAKSQGTSYSLAEIKEKGYDPLILRYFFLNAHYRSKQNFTWAGLEAARSSLNNLREKILELKEAGKGGKVDKNFQGKFISAISDDFNISQALSIVWDILKSDLPAADKLKTIFFFDEVLGLNLKDIKVEKVPAAVKELAEERLQARQEKNWAESDRLRDEIEKLGFIVEDKADSYKLKKA